MAGESICSPHVDDVRRFQVTLVALALHHVEEEELEVAHHGKLPHPALAHPTRLGDLQDALVGRADAPVGIDAQGLGNCRRSKKKKGCNRWGAKVDKNLATCQRAILMALLTGGKYHVGFCVNWTIRRGLW